MRERVVVLAVTKMLSGMCVGGIALSSRKWVRPIKEHGTLLPGDLTYKDGTVMRPFDTVDFALVKHRPQPPHVEDWSCEFARERPELAGRVISKRLVFLERSSEPDSPAQILSAARSLGLFEPSDVEATFRLDSFSGKYEARIRTPETGERPLPVTDIKWRALGRKLLEGREFVALSAGEVRATLGAERVFVALGLGREYEGRHWPLVVGLHLWPDYHTEIDYGEM